MMCRTGWVLRCYSVDAPLFQPYPLAVNTLARSQASQLYLPKCASGVLNECTALATTEEGPSCSDNFYNGKCTPIIGINTYSVGAAYVSLCGEQCGWSIDRFKLATIVRWIGDTCELPGNVEGLSGGTGGIASKGAAVEGTPEDYQVQLNGSPALG